LGKKSNGEGSICKITKTRKNGSKYTVWRARLTVGFDETGLQKQLDKTFETKHEAQEWLDKTKNFIKNQNYVDTNNITLAEWFDKWYIECLENLSPNAKYEYGRKGELYIKKSLGSVKLQKLTHEQVQKFINTLSLAKETGGFSLSPKTVKDVYSVLHKCLEAAIDYEYLSKNVSSRIVLPKIIKTQKVFSEEFLSLFLSEIKGHKHENLFLFYLYLGERRCEPLGLTWDCVDFNRKIIRISKQYRKNRITKENEFSLPKEDKERIVPMSPEVETLLIRQQAAEALKKKEMR